MLEQEGVIKFQLSHRFAPPPPLTEVAELIAWRRILYQLQLIGEDPNRYQGYGFGNISRRLAPFDDPSCRPFLITGTQTGASLHLGPEQFTTVVECSPEHNRVSSFGPVKPSSEAMTHATLYDVNTELRAVIHVHSPHIWRAATKLGLPVTDPAAEYGTSAMTEAVRHLISLPDLQKLGLFVMGGHEDGVVSFGRTVNQAGCSLIQILAAAYQMPT